jgi:two-component system cell cycle sensor histidine kinase/response regulator CckA
MDNSKQRARDILNSLDARVAVVGEGFKILDINATWEEFAIECQAGESSCWGIGSKYMREVSPESPDYDIAQQAYRGILSVQRGEAARFILEYPCCYQGETLWFLMKVLPLSGFPGQVIVAHSDITGQKNALERVEESEQRFRTFFEEAPDAIFLEGLDDTIIDANPAATRLLGYSREEFLKMSIPDLQAPEVRGVKGEVLRTELELEGCFESVNLHKSGLRVPVEVHNHVIQREGKKEVLSIVRDHTEHKKIEEELLQSRKMYQDLFENLPVGAYQSSLDGRVLAVNRACLKMARWPAGECGSFLCQDVRECYVKPADADRLRSRLLEEGEVKGFEAQVYRRDGTVCWLSNTARLVRDEDGKPLHISGTLLDITESRETARALKEESERNVALLNALPDMLFLLDKDGVFLDVHPGNGDDLLLAPGQVLGRRVSEILPGDISELTLATLREVLGHGRHKDYHYTLQVDEKKQYFEARMVRFAPSKVLSIVRNVTQAKEAEAESELLMSAIRQTGESVVITDTEGRVKFANPAFEEITGYTLDEVTGKKTSFLRSGRQDEAFYADMWQTISGGSVWKGKITNRKKDGSIFVEEMTISPVFDNLGRIVNYVAVKSDVTVAMELENQLRHVQKVESIGRLAGGIAHDLNNLLAPIFGYNELLLEELAEHDPRRELVREVMAAANGAKELVRKLLAFSRKQTLNYTPVDLNTVLTEFGKLLHRTIPENIRIRSSLARDINPALADTGQLEQVIMNLAVNAADAMPDGGTLTFTTRNLRLSDNEVHNFQHCRPGDYVVLEVEDTGCGMEKEVRELIFEPFFSTKGERGNGLGLATVYGIVRQHGGAIRVNSRRGEGSTFTVCLPSAAPDDGEAPAEYKDSRDCSGTGTVLLVEDDAGVRKIVETMLNRLGYNVILAENGEELVGRIDLIDQPVDLLLTDIIMPGMNGKELAEIVQGKFPDMRVLFISGYSGDILDNIGVFEGQVELLEKPFSRQELGLKIQEVLGS